MRVAVVGASGDRAKFGNKAVRAFRQAGHEVAPVNPRCAGAAGRIEGLPAYASIADVPGRVDVATLYVRPAVGERVIEEIAARGIRELWGEPGRGERRPPAPGGSPRARRPPAVQHPGDRRIAGALLTNRDGAAGRRRVFRG